MNSEHISIISLGVLGCCMISKKVEKLPFSLPMLFTIFGFLIGNQVLGWVPITFEEHSVHILATLALILVLFTDAARIKLDLLARYHDIPLRTLLIGMPLVILAGTLVAYYLLGLTFWQSALLASLLAPTDAALGQAVLDDEDVPIRIRQGINIESGLNDGLALPIVLIFMSFNKLDLQLSVAYWMEFIAYQLVLGPLVGILVGYISGTVLMYSRKYNWIKKSYEELASIGIALLAYGVADWVGGNGFGAAFFAGIVLGNYFRGICPCLWEFAEAEGSLVTLLTFLIFGAAMVPLCWVYFSWSVILYAILSLTFIRMIPILISLTGAGLRLDTQLFIGWFGPRGIASILFGIVILEATVLPIYERLMGIVSVTVLFSVFLHGATAYPFSRWYGRRLKESSPEEKVEEVKTVQELPYRWH